MTNSLVRFAVVVISIFILLFVAKEELQQTLLTAFIIAYVVVPVLTGEGLLRTVIRAAFIAIGLSLMMLVWHWLFEKAVLVGLLFEFILEPWFFEKINSRINKPKP